MWFLKAGLGQTKVCQADMSLLVNKNVLWFEIAVDDAGLVQVLECKRHFGSVKPRAFFIETTFLLFQVEEKFTSINELHDHI